MEKVFVKKIKSRADKKQSINWVLETVFGDVKVVTKEEEPINVRLHLRDKTNSSFWLYSNIEINNETIKTRKILDSREGAIIELDKNEMAATF